MSAVVRRTLVAAVVALLSVEVALAQPAAPVLNVQVVGNLVTVSWAPVAGATGYRAEAGVTPAQMLAAYELGPVPGFSLPAPPGIFYVRVTSRNAQGLGPPSAIAAVAVNAPIAPPAPPTNLQALVAGNTVHFSIEPPAGALIGMVLAAGGGPGQTQLVLPITALQTAVPNVPPGVYFARMHAVGPGGTSGPSNEVQIAVGAGGCVPPSAPNVQTQVTGSTVTIAWSAVAGVAGYQLGVAASPGGPAFISQPYGAGTNSVSFGGVAAGTYYVRVTAVNACGGQAPSGDSTVVVVRSGGTSGPRTPNPSGPTPPNYLPLPNRAAVVDEIARMYPNELRASCGNNAWLFRLVERLRREDTRWGLNWKRANVGDMSQDVVTYNFGSESDEGTLQVHVVDVIGGHCGGNPTGAWINQTVLFSTGAKWTLQPYLNAGFPQFPQ